MEFNEALTALLMGDEGLRVVVGQDIHWMVQPRSGVSLPYVNLQRVSDPIDYHSLGESDLRQTRVQVDIWAETYSTALRADSLLRRAVSGFRGVKGEVNFRLIRVENARDLTDKTAGAESQLFRISMDLEISWKMET